MCELVVGLGDVGVLGVGDGAGERLRIHVRCRYVSEQDPEIAPPRAKLTTRAGRWATRRAGSGASVDDVASALGCSWHPANNAVRHWGSALLGADIGRIARCEALGLD